MTSLFCVSWHVFTLVHDIPMQFWIEKSLPSIIGHLRCSHTMNVWKNFLPFMLILHFILPLAPKLLPDAPTTCGILAVFSSLRFNFWYVSKDIMLFMAPVSKSVLIFMSVLLFAIILNTVPVVGPSSSMLYISRCSATTVMK